MRGHIANTDAHRYAFLGYASAALEHGWSRAVLVHHIEARTVDRQGKALTNLTMVSMVHRRVDGAVRVPREGTR